MFDPQSVSVHLRLAAQSRASSPLRLRDSPTTEAALRGEGETSYTSQS